MSSRAPSSNAAPSGRAPFVDVLRGLAVVLMIAWHGAEGWIEPALRDGPGWRWLRVAGGLAAPAFLVLVGASVALRLGRARRAGHPQQRTHRQLVARGILVIFLGYALHLQSWLLDGLAVLRPGAARVWLPAAAGLVLAVVATGRLGRRGGARDLALLAAGTLLMAVGIHQLTYVSPGRLGPVLRFDILQHIGVAIVVVATACRATDATERPWRAVLLAVAAVATTPVAAASMPASAGSWLVRTGEAATNAPAFFPLLPWIGYGFAGAALGSTWDRAMRDGRLVTVITLVAIFGAVLALAASESLPHGYALGQRFPWIVQPMRVTHRLGLTCVLAAVALALSTLGTSFDWLRHMGQASLVVYWVHLELAFGIASRPLHHALGYAGWAAGTILLSAMMWRVARFRLGPFERWRSRLLRDGPLSGKRALL